MSLTFKIPSKYNQKSSIFCFPLLGIKAVVGKPYEQARISYFSYKDKYDFNECMLICVYDNKNDVGTTDFDTQVLFKNKYFQDIEYYTHHKVVIFNLTAIKKDYKRILEGSYSKISPNSKGVILNHRGFKQHILAWLNPENKHYEYYSKVLNEDVEIIKNVVELCNKPDLHKEVFELKSLNVDKLSISLQTK